MIPYGKKNHSRCPFCKSDDIEAGEMEIPDGPTTRQPVVCHDCGEEWVDIYQLVGYEKK